MSLDSLLATVRANACLGARAPLRIDAMVHPEGGATGFAAVLLFAPASATVQQAQGQGLIEGRRATASGDAAVIAAGMLAVTGTSRDWTLGDEIRVASGDYAGTWSVQSGNPVRGGWARADVKQERMDIATGAQELR